MRHGILAGTAISMETTHDLLDLICFYGDRDPVHEGGPQMEDTVSCDGLNREINPIFLYDITC